MRDNKRWIQQTLAHADTDAVPYNFMFSPPARKKLQSHYGVSDLEEALDLPIRMSAPASIKPLYADPAQYGESIKDEFGVVWSTSEIDRGSPIGSPLTAPDLSKYTFPDASSAYRFEGLESWCEDNGEHYTFLWVGDLWERATFMRGMENLLLELALNRNFVRTLLRGIADHILRTMTILFERFPFDGVALSDDYGTQHGPLISPKDWRSLIKPLLREIYESAKRCNRTIFHHTCGNILPIIPDLVDIGLDILHPIQPEAMDILHIKREFGRDLTLCGGVPTQDLLPRGTPEEIRREVRRLQKHMGKGSGYILEPGITLQADIPLENLVAVIDAAMNPM